MFLYEPFTPVIISIFLIFLSGNKTEINTIIYTIIPITHTSFIGKLISKGTSAISKVNDSNSPILGIIP